MEQNENSVIEVVEGNILTSGKDIIVQQVNCQGVMGSGLAKSIFERYPEVKKEYHKFYNRNKKREGFTPSVLLGAVQYVDVYDGKIVANIFGQEEFRKHRYDEKVYTDTKSLIKGIETVRDFAEQNGYSIAIPSYIGCGLANGDWNIIKPQIEKIFSGSELDVTFYHYR